MIALVSEAALSCSELKSPLGRVNVLSYRGAQRLEKRVLRPRPHLFLGEVIRRLLP